MPSLVFFHRRCDQGIGKMRGVGWAICYENPANGRLSNHWITVLNFALFVSVATLITSVVVLPL